MTPRPPQIIRKKPPNFEAIVAVFPAAASPDTIFTYGNDIYYTGKAPLSPWLMAHEGIHVLQQLNFEGGAAAWWDRYLDDVLFRFVQELNAHQVEYQSAIEQKARVQLGSRFIERDLNRIERRHFLDQVATRLSGPLYGKIVSYKEARRLILDKPVKLCTKDSETETRAATT